MATVFADANVTPAQLLERAYEELRRIAAARFAGKPPGQSLRPTDLVHEAYLKIASGEDRHWESQRHFINSVGTAMRSILIDRARTKKATRRGGASLREPLHSDLVFYERDPAELIALDEALDALSAVDSRAAQVVCLRLFLGLSEVEIADLLDVTDRTVQRDWKFARAWLSQALQACEKQTSAAL